MNIPAERLQNQRLIGPPFSTAADVVGWLGAVQSQDYHGAKWGIALRMGDATDADLDKAFNDGSILRTHMMRPTWHFVAPEDLRWIQALTADRVNRFNAMYYRKLELDRRLFRECTALITASLESGFKTRSELADVLADGGFPTTGQRLAYVMMHAELDALICSGPLRGRQHTYALVDERVPPTDTLSHEEALGKLTRRFFSSHGPATPHDFAWWSGLTVSDARRGLDIVGSDLVPERLDDTTYWAASPPGHAELDSPAIHLLPNYDEHLVGYRDRRTSIDPVMMEAAQDAAADTLGAHFVVRDGMVIGGWRRRLGRAAAELTITVPIQLEPAERTALGAAIDSYSAYLDTPVVVTSS